jgi:hypothetical protein
MLVWTYLAVSGWYSTYMLIGAIGDAWRNGMFWTLGGNVFVWTVSLMALTSFAVIGLLYYGRYTRKKKEVIRAAVTEAKTTGVWIDPKMRFDPAVLPFWIGASVLNVLFGIVIMTASVSLYGGSGNDAYYPIAGMGIAFFLGLVMYVATEYLTNGVLDGKAVKSLISSVAGSAAAQNIVGMFCRRIGIADQMTIDRIFENVREHIKARGYEELTPDEVLLLNKMAEEVRKGSETKRSFL